MNEKRYLKKFRADFMSEHGAICRYCKKPLSMSTATVDHIKPRSRGGRTEKNNLLVCCADCNIAKDSLPIRLFEKSIKNSPKPDDTLGVWLAWSRRKIWKRATKAIKHIHPETLERRNA